MPTIVVHHVLMEELRIIVPESLVMDGQQTIPSVGEQVEYLLGFQEEAPASFPEASNRVEARGEYVATSRIADADAAPEIAHHFVYEYLLHSDNWCALFRSRTPAADPIKLVGTFEAAFPGEVPDQASVAGTVTACRLITRTSWPDDGGRYSSSGITVLSPVRDGQTGFRSGLVADVPEGFQGSGWFPLIPPPNGPWVHEDGVLVTLRVKDRSSRT